MVMNAYSIPQGEITQGKKELTITPVYAKAESLFSVGPAGGDSIDSIDITSDQDQIQYTEDEAKGGGVVVSWFHGINDQWGYSLSASHVRLSGRSMAFAEYDASGNFSAKNFADEDGHATQLMAYFVYDTMKKSKHFSLPIFVGGGLYYASQDASTTKTVNVTGLNNIGIKYNAEIDTLTYGLALGFAFKVNISDFRFGTFLLAYIAPSAPEYEVTATRTDTGANLIDVFNTEKETDSIFPSGGFSLTYTPWDFTVSWVPNIFNLIGGDKDQVDTFDNGLSSTQKESTDQSVITLSKSFTF
jgi:hypothetical protein